MNSAEKAYAALCEHARETALLESIQEVISWDERTMLPPAAGEYRAEQITLLSGLLHERQTDARVGQWTEQLLDSPLASDTHSDTGATIRQIRRDYEKNTKLPKSLVEELTRVSVRGQQAWVEARETDDFELLRPWLERIVELKRQQAEAQGYANCPYDALLDDFEQGASTAEVETVLQCLRDQLMPLIQAIGDSGRSPPVELLQRNYPIQAQADFGKEVAATIGFDFKRGRLDTTHHPFCTSLGPNDCRLTTRYDEYFFPSAFFGILHEAGHGIYEQGLRPELFGLPPGSAVSLGVHESQSRLWENFVGRGRSFWKHFFPQARRYFPKALNDSSLDDFHWSVNDIRPSLIRVEADEATYNLHIIVRFELEQELVSDHLQVSDLPAAWNDRYDQYLGLRPKSDAHGVLQDIHWSAALIGYFPTYSLGNIYAAQLFAKANEEVGPLEEQFARGDFRPLRRWLHEKVYSVGRCFDPAELVHEITGQALATEPLIDHLKAKLMPVYGLT